MQFKKKKKRKYDNLDEDLKKEQELLFNAAHSNFLQAQMTIPTAQSIFEKTKSAPFQLPNPLINDPNYTNKLFLELDKGLTEKPNDIIDFDALRTNS